MILISNVLKLMFKAPLTAPIMKRLGRSFENHLRISENWDNCDPRTNGEYWLLARIAPGAQIVCDVGCNRGDWTADLLSKGFKGQVYAFEASPETAKVYEDRYRSNTQIILNKFGLGDKEGQLTFYDYGPISGLNSFIPREKSIQSTPKKTYLVDCKRLDQVLLDRVLLEQEIPGQVFSDQAFPGQVNSAQVPAPQVPCADGTGIDFLKIDTEGHDLAVLRGAEALLDKKAIGLLQFEYGGTWIDSKTWLGDAFEYLWKKGYLVGRLMPDRIQWIDKGKNHLSEPFLYSNFVACKSLTHAQKLRIY